MTVNYNMETNYINVLIMYINKVYRSLYKKEYLDILAKELIDDITTWNQKKDYEFMSSYKKDYKKHNFIDIIINIYYNQTLSNKLTVECKLFLQNLLLDGSKYTLLFEKDELDIRMRYENINVFYCYSDRIKESSLFCKKTIISIANELECEESAIMNVLNNGLFSNNVITIEQVEFICCIAKALSCSPEYLLGLTNIYKYTISEIMDDINNTELASERADNLKAYMTKLEVLWQKNENNYKQNVFGQQNCSQEDTEQDKIMLLFYPQRFDYYSEYIDRLQLTMCTRGLSVKDLTKRIEMRELTSGAKKNVSNNRRGLIGSLLKGDYSSKINYRLLVEISRALDCTPEYLLGLTDYLNGNRIGSMMPITYPETINIDDQFGRIKQSLSHFCTSKYEKDDKFDILKQILKFDKIALNTIENSLTQKFQKHNKINFYDNIVISNLNNYVSNLAEQEYNLKTLYKDIKCTLEHYLSAIKNHKSEVFMSNDYSYKFPESFINRVKYEYKNLILQKSANEDVICDIIILIEKYTSIDDINYDLLVELCLNFNCTPYYCLGMTDNKCENIRWKRSFSNKGTVSFITDYQFEIMLKSLVDKYSELAKKNSDIINNFHERFSVETDLIIQEKNLTIEGAISHISRNTDIGICTLKGLFYRKKAASFSVICKLCIEFECTVDYMLKYTDTKNEYFANNKVYPSNLINNYYQKLYGKSQLAFMEKIYCLCAELSTENLNQAFNIILEKYNLYCVKKRVYNKNK